MSVSVHTRRIVLERDQWSCVSCGRYLNLYDYSLHHRIPRGMGGTKAAWIDQPANLISLCGSGTTGCHGWVEHGDRGQAVEWGYIIRRGVAAQALPEAVKVLTYPRGWLLYDNAGGVAEWPMPNWSSEQQREWETLVRDARETRTRRAA